MAKKIMKGLMILICFISLSCGTKKVLQREIFDQSVDIHEPGKCYYSIRNNESDEWIYRPPVLLEIEDPIYTTKVKSFKVSELLAKHPNQNTISILTRKAHMSYQFRISQLEELNYKRDAEYAYCIIEQSPLYKAFHKDSLPTGNIEVEIIEISKPSIIKYYEVNKKPEMVEENQLYLPSGRWSEERELVYGSYCPPNIYLKIKKALIERGFDLDDTNELNSKLKEALQQFQKQNNLPVGQLDFETLKLLGVN